VNPLITVDNISKEFGIGNKTNQNILEKLVYSISGKEKQKKFFALKNISFELKEGQNIGLIGRNGAGKSTLLKILDETYLPTSGKIITNEKIFYISGYNLGLNSKLTTRENIYFIGTLYGLSNKDIDSLFNEIIEFSGLKEFIDTKIHHFSSGMRSRLSFSAGINFILFNKPKIILMDEVFSGGGDEEFRKKAIKKTEELIQGGTTFILATHSLGLIQKYCKKVILLEKGEIISIGEPHIVIPKYNQLINQQLENKQLNSKKIKNPKIYNEKNKLTNETIPNRPLRNMLRKQRIRNKRLIQRNRKLREKLNELSNNTTNNPPLEKTDDFV
jgi:ABC-type polysaccharide/polyol phosphate transport system ATPase subunit